MKNQPVSQTSYPAFGTPLQPPNKCRLISILFLHLRKAYLIQQQQQQKQQQQKQNNNKLLTYNNKYLFNDVFNYEQF